MKVTAATFITRMIWGVDLIATVIRDMWNLAITVLSSVHRKPPHLFHNKIKNPDVVIMANGRSYLAQDKVSTDFNATRPFSADYRKPGGEFLHFLHLTISIDMNQKLATYSAHGQRQGKPNCPK